MSPSGDINKLGQTLNAADFQNLLNGSVLNQNDKEMVLSIFNKISQGDGELSAEEWESFIGCVDANKDNKLSDKEFSSATSKKASQFFKDSKAALIHFYNIVKNFIEQAVKPKSANSTKETVLYAPSNQYRHNSATRGTFTGGWLYKDEKGSTTYEEWLRNNNYEFNDEVAGELQRQARKRDYLKGSCAKAIKLSMSDTTAVSYDRFQRLQEDSNDGLPDDESNELSEEFKSNKLFNNMQAQGYAYQYASELAGNPYFKELPYNIVSTMDLKDLPKGCVIVYDANYKSSPNAAKYDQRYHTAGHIAVTDGNGKDSGGGYYNIVDGKKTTHIRVFIPIKIPDTEET